MTMTVPAGALCAHPNHDADLWFDGGREAIRRARRVCGACPVRAACLAAALDFGPKLAGVWGGTTAQQRGRIRARRHRLEVFAAQLTAQEVGA